MALKLAGYHPSGHLRSGLLRGVATAALILTGAFGGLLYDRMTNPSYRPVTLWEATFEVTRTILQIFREREQPEAPVGVVASNVRSGLVVEVVVEQAKPPVVKGHTFLGEDLAVDFFNANGIMGRSVTTALSRNGIRRDGETGLFVNNGGAAPDAPPSAIELAQILHELNVDFGLSLEDAERQISVSLFMFIVSSDFCAEGESAYCTTIELPIMNSRLGGVVVFNSMNAQISIERRGEPMMPPQGIDI